MNGADLHKRRANRFEKRELVVQKMCSGSMKIYLKTSADLFVNFSIFEAVFGVYATQ